MPTIIGKSTGASVTSSVASVSTQQTPESVGGQVGDLIIIGVSQERASLPTLNLTGLTTIRSEDSGSECFIIAWKRLTDQDITNNVVATVSGTNRRLQVSYLIIRNGVDPKFVNGPRVINGNGDFAAEHPSVDLVSDDALLLSVMGAVSNVIPYIRNFSSSIGWTEQIDSGSASNAVNAYVYMGTKQLTGGKGTNEVGNIVTDSQEKFINFPTSLVIEHQSTNVNKHITKRNGLPIFFEKFTKRGSILVSNTKEVSSGNITPAPAAPTQTVDSMPSLLRRWRADSISLADGAAVTTWPARVGNATLTPETIGLSPVFVTNAVDGKPGVKFANSDQRLSVTTLTRSQPITMVVVTADFPDLDAQVIAHGSEVFKMGTPGNWIGYSGIRTTAVAANRAVGAQTMTYIANGLTSQVYVNGSLSKEGDSGTTGFSNKAIVGANEAGTGRYFNGTILEIQEHAGILGASERAQINTEIQKTYPSIVVSDFLVAVAPSERGAVHGITSRSFDQTQTNFKDIVDGAVIDFEWKQFHTAPGTIDVTFKNQLLSQLDWCRSTAGTSGKSLRVRLRPRMGMYAPDWVKTNTGSMTWYTDKGFDGTGSSAPSNSLWKEIPGGIPRWWVPQYLAAAEEFYALMRTHFGSHPALCEIVMGWPATQFAEPCLKQFGLQENLDSALSAGWTETLDVAAFEAGWNSHKTHFSPINIGCYTAYNPIGSVDTSVTPARYSFGNTPKTVELMNKQVQILGNKAVVANNSLTAPVTVNNSHYVEMYNHMLTLRNQGTRITFQSETLGRHLNNYPTETIKNTLELAVAWRAQGVEIPVGCEKIDTALYNENFITPTYAKSINPQFESNRI